MSLWIFKNTTWIKAVIKTIYNSIVKADYLTYCSTTELRRWRNAATFFCFEDVIAFQKKKKENLWTSCQNTEFKKRFVVLSITPLNVESFWKCWTAQVNTTLIWMTSTVCMSVLVQFLRAKLAIWKAFLGEKGGESYLKPP